MAIFLTMLICFIGIIGVLVVWSAETERSKKRTDLLNTEIDQLKEKIVTIANMEPIESLNELRQLAGNYDTTERIVKPTEQEHAYHRGWTAYYNKLGINANPYQPDVELKNYEAWENGWTTAQMSDRVNES